MPALLGKTYLIYNQTNVMNGMALFFEISTFSVDINPPLKSQVHFS